MSPDCNAGTETEVLDVIGLITLKWMDIGLRPGLGIVLRHIRIGLPK